MGSFKLKKATISILGIVLVMAGLVQCTKENENAMLVSRALVDQPDSTIYSSFYDTYIIDKADATSNVNDSINTTGIQTIIGINCASAACHGGNIAPKLTNYNEIKTLVVPGNPEGSKLYDLVTTSDVNKAMPPINYGVDLSQTEKTKIYNWIRNGALEKPTLIDFRPAAVSLIVNGCGSANCHNQATVGGAWARRKLIDIAPTDTVSYSYYNPGTGTTTIYAQLKEPKLSQVWGAYKDSVRKFYADTVANASFRPYKTFSTPIVASNVRGPLNSYDDLIFDATYPKSRRSSGTVTYTNTSGVKFYVFGDYLNTPLPNPNDSRGRSPASSMVSRVDSTMKMMGPKTKVYNLDQTGDMAYSDGGLSKSEIALIKAWYFADPNIPDVWKYGIDGLGIFKYTKTGTVIKK